MIIGIDLGRTVGVGGVDKLGIPVFAHTWTFPQHDHAVLAYSFYLRLVTSLRRFEPTLVSFEDLSMLHIESKAWRSIWFGMRTAVYLACLGLSIEYREVTVHEWHREFNIPHRKPDSETFAMIAADKLQRSLPDSQRVEICTADQAVGLLVAAYAQRRVT